jgi:hypothetical protein
MQGEMRRVCDKHVALEAKAKEQQALVRKFMQRLRGLFCTSGAGSLVVRDYQLMMVQVLHRAVREYMHCPTCTRSAPRKALVSSGTQGEPGKAGS